MDLGKADKMKMTYEQAVSYLYEIPKFTKKNGLEHTKELLRRLDIREGNFKIIHVAGSNGKGSVCRAISEVLTENQKSNGLFISPHLVRMEERFCINGKMCSVEEFLEAFHCVYEVVERMQKEGLAHPTFFEYLFGMGMWIFQKKRVEYLVLETGLGGRLDCTNVFTHPLLTIITSISLEHTEYLGDTIEKIAAEKAGIIKQGVPVLYDAGNEKADQVISTKASACQAKIYPVHRNSLKFPKFNGKYIDFYFQCDYDVDTKISIPFAAPYQMMNMTLAYQAMRMLEPETGIKKEEILKGIRNTRWQGRMQEVGENIYFDGAHNVEGIHAFLDSVALIRPQNPILLFSMVSDKDYEKAIQLLAERGQWEQVIVTTISDKRGIPAEDIARIFSHFGQQAVVIEDSRKAYEWALKGKKRGQALFCTGSLYFIGELLEITGGKNSD